LTADATIIAPRAAAGDIAGSAELYLRPETGSSTASKQPAVAESTVDRGRGSMYPRVPTWDGAWPSPAAWSW
jgi:hypothetical protein